MVQDCKTRQGNPTDLEFIGLVQRESMSPHAIRQYGHWDDEAQKKQISESDPCAHEIFEVAGRPIGCALVKREFEQIRLVRLYILPSFQRKGIGSQFVSKVCSEADKKKLPITLRVLKVNPAKQLYERFGFQQIEETETHYYLRRPIK